MKRCLTTITLAAVLPVSAAAQTPATELAANAPQADAVELTWKPAPTAHAQHVMRGTGAGGALVVAQLPRGAAAYRDAAVVSGTTYTYQIETHHTNLRRTTSQPVSVTTPAAPAGTTGAARLERARVDPAQIERPPLSLEVVAPPPAPASVQAYALQPTAVRIQWSRPPDATGVEISRAIGGEPAIRLTPTPVSGNVFDDTGVAPGLAITYQLAALYPDGRRGETAVSVSTPPVQMTNVSAVHTGGGDVEVRWSPVPGARSIRLVSPLGESFATTSPYVIRGVNEGQWSIALSPMFFVAGTNREWPGGTTATGVHVPRLSGFYRAVLKGFEVHQETRDDDPWQRDGKRDEVFVTVLVDENESVRTPIFGDVNPPLVGDRSWFQPPKRLQAGEASNLGGLKTGDAVFGPAIERVAWCGPLSYGKEIRLITPVVWEWDQPHAGHLESRYKTWAANLSAQLKEDAYTAMVHTKWYEGGGSTIYQSAALVDLGITAWATYPGLTDRENRPIGLARNNGFVPRGIPLTFRVAEDALQSRQGDRPHGWVPVTYQDEDPARGGHYTVWIAIERVNGC
jgi:hypothetical protein